MTALLKVSGLQAFYGQIRALHGIDFEIEQGGITTILGANGAGKTTTLRAVCGMIRVQGEITFDGERLDGKATEEIVRRGIAHVPDGRGTFTGLTVEENLRLGAYVRGDKAEVQRDFDYIYERFPRLKERRQQQAGTLSGGEQQMLVLARGLMSRPRVLMMDEPSLGLAPILVQEVFETLGRLRREGLTILLVEQMAWMALEVCDRAYVLETGRVVAQGRGSELLANAQVLEAYLGRRGAGKRAAAPLPPKPDTPER